jgi:hypothetical protein
MYEKAIPFIRRCLSKCILNWIESGEITSEGIFRIFHALMYMYNVTQIYYKVIY